MTEEELHTAARSYIDDVLAIHKAVGETSGVSAETYSDAVEAIESVLHEMVELTEHRPVASL